jgi:hypothetical protein
MLFFKDAITPSGFAVKFATKNRGRNGKHIAPHQVFHVAHDPQQKVRLLHVRKLARP